MPEQTPFARRVFLSEVPAGPVDRKLVGIAASICVLVFAALVPFAQVPLPQVWAFIPAYQSALIVGDLITAVLLFAQFAILRSRALLILAAGFLFCAFIAGVHALTFPGLFVPTGLLGAGPQSTAWIYMFWHGVFPLAVIAATLTRNGGSAASGLNCRAAIVAAVLGVAIVVAAVTVLATAGQDLLPPIMQGNRYTPIMHGVIGTVWGLSLIALVVLVRRRPHSVLDMWLIIVMCAWIADIGLSAVFNAGRFDLGFYAGRLFGLLAANFVLMALLLETVTLYTRLLQSFEMETFEREQRLKAVDDARAAADAANVAKSTFLATMSHEIRTPLNGIVANLELLGRTRLDDDQIELLVDANKASMALLGLIGNILDFSKIEEGKFVFELGDVDIVALTEEAVNVLQSKARQKDIFIVTSFAADLPRIVRCDGPRIRQILLNLIGNALKFTDRGGILVELSVKAPDRDVCDLLFMVHDSGKGFNQADAGKLFEAFVQDGSNRPGTEGTGLGLSICRSLVENFGGTIACDGTQGEGATFVFTIPAAVVQPAGPVNKPDLSDGKVLLAGAMDGDQRYLEDYFRACGAIVETVQGITFDRAVDENAAAQESDLFRFAVFLLANVEDIDPMHLLRLREQGHATLIWGPEFSFHNVRRSLRAGFPGLIQRNCSTEYLDRNIRRLTGQGPSRTFRRESANDREPSDIPIFQGEKRILVLEDRLVNQTAIRKQLKALGLGCTLASDGLKGLKAYEQGGFDLILCDCSMPEMNGFDFTRAVRRMEKEAGDGRHVPIVALTANAFQEDAEKCLDAGMDDFMSKPIPLARMAAILDKWLTLQPPVPVGPAQPVGIETPPIDIGALAENLGTNEKADFDEVLAQFLTVAGDSLASVKDAFSTGDPEKILAAVHGAKGEAQSVVAGKLAKVYAEMERRTNSRDLEDLRNLVALAAAELRRVEEFIRRRAESSTA